MTTSNNEIILEGPENYHSWFSNIKGSVPEDLWKYFDPETDDLEYVEPEPVTVATIRPEATTLQQLTATDRSLYAQFRTNYNQDVSRYHRYLSEKAKLRTKLFNTIPEQKRILLSDDESIKQWIVNIKLATKPSDTHMKDVTKSKHRSLMTAKFLDWPNVGPDKWLLEWQRLMSECKKWSPAQYSDWASDFNLVWGEVPGAKQLCDQLKKAETNGKMDKWDINKASLELKQAWDQRVIRSGMRIAGKPRTTRAVFATDVRFNGLNGTIEEDTEQTAQDRSGPRKRAATDSLQRPSYKRPARTTTRVQCWGCKGPHPHFYCPLVMGSNRKKINIPRYNQQIFQKRMMDPTFADKIKKLREADLITKTDFSEKAEVC